MQRRESIERYRGARFWLDEAIAFIEAASPYVPAAVYPKQNADMWLGQLLAYQSGFCERCGTCLVRDMLGWEAFAVNEEFRRVCGICHDELVQHVPVMRRFSRLRAFAQEHPELMAGVIVEAQQRWKLDDYRLPWKLGVDEVGVLRLALCHRPRAGHEAEDKEKIAAIAGCTPQQLQHILFELPQENLVATPVTEEIIIPF
jgi:hypothetical protein